MNSSQRTHFKCTHILLFCYFSRLSQDSVLTDLVHLTSQYQFSQHYDFWSSSIRYFTAFLPFCSHHIIGFLVNNVLVYTSVCVLLQLICCSCNKSNSSNFHTLPNLHYHLRWMCMCVSLQVQFTAVKDK